MKILALHCTLNVSCPSVEHDFVSHLVFILLLFLQKQSRCTKVLLILTNVFYWCKNPRIVYVALAGAHLPHRVFSTVCRKSSFNTTKRPSEAICWVFADLVCQLVVVCGCMCGGCASLQAQQTGCSTFCFKRPSV